MRGRIQSAPRRTATTGRTGTARSRRAGTAPGGCEPDPSRADFARRDSAIYRTRLIRRGGLPDSDLPQEGVLVRLPPEELAEQLVRIHAPPLGEDDVPVVAARLRVEDALAREAREHVGREHLAPQIPVVARVVAAHHVTEPGGEVRLRVLGEGHDLRPQALGRGVGLDLRAVRVDVEI